MKRKHSNGKHLNGVDVLIGSHSQAMDDSIRRAVRCYLKDMGDHEPDNLYKMFLQRIERPLLEEVLRWTDENQTRTARVLGLNRGTLRKKLSQLSDS